MAEAQATHEVAVPDRFDTEAALRNTRAFAKAIDTVEKLSANGAHGDLLCPTYYRSESGVAYVPHE